MEELFQLQSDNVLSTAAALGATTSSGRASGVRKSLKGDERCSPPCSEEKTGGSACKNVNRFLGGEPQVSSSLCVALTRLEISGHLLSAP